MVRLTIGDVVQLKPKYVAQVERNEYAGTPIGQTTVLGVTDRFGMKDGDGAIEIGNCGWRWACHFDLCGPW